MKKMFCICLTTLALLPTAISSWASSCPPATSISVAVSYTYTFGGSSIASAVSPDSSSAYVNGVNGVSAIINGCTNDAILDLGKSTRYIGLSLQSVVAPSSYTPSWTGTAFWAKPHIDIRNILYHYNAGASYSFTTQAEISFTAPDGSSDQLQFVNPNARASSVAGTLLNSPYNTSLVVVTHSPADPSTGAVETWTITPDNANMDLTGASSATQVAGLLVPAGRNKSANGGQFSMPFQFTITRN